MKTKYLIDHRKVGNLKKWCKDMNLSARTFEGAIRRAKKKKRNWAYCLGHYIVKL